MNSEEFENTIPYTSLTEDKKTTLRQQYLSEIANIDESICIPCFCCTNLDVENNSLCNDSVIELYDILIEKCYIHKLFYGVYREEEIKEVYDYVQKDEKNKYNNKNPRLLAQVLIWTIKWNNIPFFPHEFNKVLFLAYLENNRQLQLEIVRRIPFVINERNRTFFIKLKKLIEEIDAHKSNSETTKNDLLHIFGPIVFKGTFEGKHVFGYHRMVILADVLEADFFNVKVD